MKDQNLDSIYPIKLNDFWLFPVKSGIRKLFENEEVEFQIKIKNNKIIIESSEILADPNFQDNIPESEAINV